VVLTVGGGLLLTGRTEAAGPKTYTVASSPAALTSVTTPASITLTNNSRNNISFAALNLAVPSGVVVTGPITSTASGSTATLVGQTIQVRGLNVPSKGPSTSVTVSFSARTTSLCSSLVFTSDVRQSNDFNGTNNKFVLEGRDATFSTPCNSATVTCTAGDTKACSTGTITSGGSNTASVTVNEGDTISAVLTAELVAGALSCPEYNPTSDQLNFDIDVSAGSVAGVTKTVTFTQAVPVVSGSPDPRDASEYQVCFQAPYDFPALLPSELESDVNTGDFGGNTTAAGGGEFKGLLLHCGLNQGVPCVEDRTITGGVVSITVEVPALDPGMRF